MNMRNGDDIVDAAASAYYYLTEYQKDVRKKRFYFWVQITFTMLMIAIAILFGR
jgi:hypothetical protein